MIYGLSGRPGSGKSYEAVVTHIIPALKDGRKVITNIPLNVQWFVDVFGRHMLDLIVVVDGGFHNYGNSRFFSDADDFLQFKDWRNDKNQSVYFVVDECHLVMGKITPSEFMPEERIERLRQQKKLKE
jgi:zona occludens toxin